MNFTLPTPKGKLAIPYFIAVVSALMISISVFNIADRLMSGGVHYFDNTKSNLLEEEGIIDDYLLHDVRLTKVYGMDYSHSQYFCVGYFTDADNNEICTPVVIEKDEALSAAVDDDWNIKDYTISGRFRHDKTKKVAEYTATLKLKDYDLHALAEYNNNEFPDEFSNANNRINTLVYIGEIEDYIPTPLYEDIKESVAVFIIGIFFLFCAKVIHNSMYGATPEDKTPIEKPEDFGTNDFWDACYLLKEKSKGWVNHLMFWIIIGIIVFTVFLIITQLNYYKSIEHITEWRI